MLAGTLFALGCAVFWLFANVTIRPSSRRYGPLPALVWAQIAGLIPALGIAFIAEGAPAGYSTRALISLAIASLAALLAYGGLFTALARGKLSVVAPIISAWSALSVLIGLIWLGESLTILRGFAIILVLACNAWLAHMEGRSESKSSASTTALLAAAVSFVGFGLMVPAVKVLGEEVGPAWAVPAVWGLELALALPLLALLGQLKNVPRSCRDWIGAGRPGLFEVAGFLCISFAIAPGRAPVSVVGPISSLATAFSVLWGLFLLKEKLPPAAIIAAAGASLGVILVSL